MGDKRKLDRCRLCGRARPEGELLSWRGKCADCADAAVADAIAAMVHRRGPRYERWLARVRAAGIEPWTSPRNPGRRGDALRDNRDVVSAGETREVS